VTVGEVERPGSAVAPGTAVYAYGVVHAGEVTSVRTQGVDGAAVETVESNGLAALVATVRTPIRAKRRELLGHSGVLDEVASAATVLPLRFGTTFPDTASVARELLDARRDGLKRLLAALDGKVELLVKAFYREEAVLAEIVRGDERIARLSAATRGQPSAVTHPVRLELGTAVARALDATTRRDADAILRELRPLAAGVRLDATPVEQQVLRASLLVERERVPEVDAVLDRIAAAQAERMHFTYAGPLAPHSFVDLEAQWAS
jgi:Gas vesicle synthesis protein GvpL/GvpF